MIKSFDILFFVLFLITLTACDNDTIDDRDNHKILFKKIDSEHSNLTFTNTLTNTSEFNIFSYRNFYNGGGVAIGDINNDGQPDIYLTSNLGSNKLYLNKGNMQFEDISQSAGIEEADKWSTGVSMVDINNDGFLDIYICNAGQRAESNQKNALFINQKDNTFLDEAEAYGLADAGYTTHTAFFDYDQDGDLDAYILNNSFIPVNTLNYSNKRDLRAEDWQVKDFLKGGGDKLMRNDNGSFQDVSEEAGIYGSLIGFGLGVVIADVNGDSYPDIYVCNDFFERDYLYINNQEGGFSEELERRMQHISHSSMGADFGDLNNDGHFEIFVTDMLPGDETRKKKTTTFDNIDLRTLKVNQGFYNQFMQNTLQLNEGNGQFSEVSNFAGVEATDWSWGALMFDADNDGLEDILVCNGIYKDVIDQDFIDFFANDIIQKQALTGKKEEIETIINKMPSVPLQNDIYSNQGNLRFERKSEEWGLKEETFSNGAAYGDLDNDGDLDLVISNVNQEVLFYENQSEQHFTSLILRGDKANIMAVGSVVTLYCGEYAYTKTLMPFRGFQSSVDYKLNFGLGNLNSVDSAEIIWPTGEREKFFEINVDTINVIHKGEGLILPQSNAELQAPSILTEMDLVSLEHREDDYVDFYYERNIPIQLSKEGPTIALGDYNEDGYDDLFFGGAHQQPGQLLMGGPKGFKPVQTELFEKFKGYEDTASEFIDIDNDGDLDLVVGSGGNNVQFDNRAFIDRLYINNNGVFEYSYNAIPPNALNTSIILSHDINEDGFADLFVGSRSIPGGYGLSPGSFIYLNNRKGRFVDVTADIVPELQLASMITDARWVDLVGDDQKELLVVGEWMAPKIIQWTGSKFEIITTSLDSFSGFWQAVETLDIDQDGDQDIVLGNIGENFALEANDQEPLLLWIGDYDDNGSIEKVLTKRRNGMDQPVMMKRDLIDQIPGLKKQNILHSEYATKSIFDLFPKEKLQNSTIKQVNYLSSVIAYNLGGGKFEIEQLEPNLQWSSVNALHKVDLDEDGIDEIIGSGNNRFFLPQFGSLDAGSGFVLKTEDNNLKQINTGNGWLKLNEKGEVVRSIEHFSHQGQRFVIIGINDAKARILMINKESI
ncbi:VCBS repeat-containing protein [Portibacter marinus]|uniref:VCBS repeat-containing protein n=1 Tax=Portibacter marinus TaxID=2898660 RepID=UPI001F3D847A|nr:VCBS repeat-containing protein [Portibacter marinus]